LPKELNRPELAQFPDSAAQESIPPQGQIVPGRTTGPVAQPHSPKVGRNEPCPCGSGKKFKKCCGE